MPPPIRRSRSRPLRRQSHAVPAAQRAAPAVRALVDRLLLPLGAGQRLIDAGRIERGQPQGLAAGDVDLVDGRRRRLASPPVRPWAAAAAGITSITVLMRSIVPMSASLAVAPRVRLSPSTYGPALLLSVARRSRCRTRRRPQRALRGRRFAQLPGRFNATAAVMGGGPSCRPSWLNRPAWVPRAAAVGGRSAVEHAPGGRVVR